MERTLNLWVGSLLVGFFGRFSIWLPRSSATTPRFFWVCLAGVAVGSVLLLVWTIATGVALALRETAGDRDLQS
jgi:hypothetical protein